RFCSPQLAEAIVGGGAADPLKPHRREISVVFLDLRGFTAFADMSEPEEVSEVLGAYHAEAGRVILEHEGTLERFTGDGMMSFFNDPVPVTNPEERAVRMAEAMRARIRVLGAEWRRRGYDLDLGMGIAKGYATIGAIGFEGRRDYAAIGSVTNLAFRLCAEASPGQILISQRIYAAVHDLVAAKEVGPLQLQGFHRPVVVYEIAHLKQPGTGCAHPYRDVSPTRCGRWGERICRPVWRCRAGPCACSRRPSTTSGRPPDSTRTTPAAGPCSRCIDPRDSAVRRSGGSGAGNARARSPSTGTCRVSRACPRSSTASATPPTCERSWS